MTRWRGFFDKAVGQLVEIYDHFADSITGRNVPDPLAAPAGQGPMEHASESSGRSE